MSDGNYPRRILIIETGGWGGICHYTYNLANNLAQTSKSSQVTLLSNKNYELHDWPRHFNLIQKFDIIKLSYLSNVLFLLKSFSSVKPDIIHIQSILIPRKDWLLFLIARILNVPLIYTVHNILPHEEGEKNARGLKFAFTIIYQSAKRLIVHSNSNQRELAQLFKINPSKISIIRHGDYSFILPKAPLSADKCRKELNLHKTDRIILFFGTIRRYKGIDDLIRAFKIIADKRTDTILLIIGKATAIGEESPIAEYQNLVSQLQLENRVIFRSEYIPLRDIYKYFIASDVAVYPYTDTTESGALQLALACSKPVIASDVGSFSDAIENGKNGYLIPARNSTKLSKYLLKMLELDVKELRQMGNHSKYITNTKYSWQKIALKTHLLYQSVIR